MIENKLRLNIVIVLFTLLCPFMYVNVVAQNIPPSTTNLVLWLKADSGIVKFGATDSVQGWEDGAGTNEAAVQATAANMPRLINGGPLVNGKPVLAFDGNNDIMTGPILTGLGAGQYSIFILANGNNQTGNSSYGFFGMATGEGVFDIFRRSGTNENIRVLSTSGSLTSATGSFLNAGFPYRVISVTQNTGTNGARLRVNGTLSATNTLGAFADNIYTIGRANATLNGNIAEILVYNTSLADTTRAKVEAYLYDKYAPPISFGTDTINVQGFCSYTLNASNRYVSYQWNTGSTDSAIAVNSSGTYIVSVVDIFGRVSSDTIVVNLPRVNVNVPNTILCAGNSILLTTQYSSPQYTFNWNNGLANSDAITVNTAGIYYVKVTDVNSSCVKYSDTVSISIDSFSSTVSLGPDVTLCSGNIIKLVSPTNISQLSYSWSPGGSTDSTIVVNNSGIYAVTVSNVNGCTVSDAVNVTVTGSAPIASFSGDTLCLGEVYLPINTSYVTDASTIVANSWTFGDGGNSNAPLPAYYYATASSYVATLTVTTSSGCSATAVRNVLVRALPSSSISNNTLGCINNATYFTAQAVPALGSSVVQWNWEFGDGGVSNLQNPQHAYGTVGSFNPQLIITDSYGCKDTSVSSIAITNNASTPSALSYVIPSSNIVISSTNVNFEWTPGSNAIAYRLVIANDSMFTSATSYYFGNGTNTAVSLSQNAIYYWKVRAYNVCNDSVDFARRSFTIFSPATNGALRLWLSADTGIVKLGATDSVQYWNDYAGTNDTARQVAATNMPRLINGGPLVNNKPVLAFDGTNDVMTGPALTGLGAGGYTVFVLANGNNQTGNSSYGLFGVTNGEGAFDIYRRAGTSQNIAVLAGSATSAPVGSFPATGYPYRLISVTQTTGTNGTRLRVNDTLVATGTLGTFADDIYTVGRANATINGNIAEIMVFPTVLNDSVRRIVERYVYDKYAPPVNLGPDIVQTYSLCPIILNASNRFVRYLWSDGSTADTLRVKIGGTYWVRVTDVFGRVSADTIKVTLPYGGTSFVDTVLCYGNAATLQPIISSTPYTYAWNSGQNTSTISIAEQGSYVVTITDTNACVLISDTVDVKVDSFNLVSLLPTDTTTCTGNILAIDNHGYAISAVNWSTGANAESIIVAGGGAYTVTAISDNQCTLNDSINIAIKGVAPTVDFSVTNACLGNANQFNDLSSTQVPDRISGWYWDFGDNNTDIAPTISHAYNDAGIYNVTLTVLTDSGCSAAMSKPATVFSLPSAVISQLAPICAQNGSRISGVSVAPVGAAIASYEWQVAGNIVSSDTTLRYNFPSQGVVPITLVVTSTQGCADTTTRSIEVYAPFVADFEVDNVCVGDSSFFFDVTPSYSIVSRTWNFGDATSAIGTPNPVKKYNAAGSYDVTLTVTNAIGCRSIKTKPVIAASKPVANFNILEGCESDFYKPIDASTSAQEPINSWLWTIGGFVYSSQAPQRYFATPGAYPVKLVVATATGCKDSISKTAVIYAKPTVNFSYTPLYGDAPLNVTFTNQSSNDSTYFWQFGDGGTSAQENPVYTYTQNGEYNVTLVATSPYGCTASRTKPYSVIKTDLDYAVNEAAVQITPLPNGSSLAKVSVIGSNIGTRIIDHISYYVTLGGVGVIAEDWQGTLLSGQGLLDTFSAQFVVPEGKGDSYICVTAVNVNNGQQELRTDNNSQCLGISEGIKVMGPLPNPALNEAKLGLILPKHGKVTLDIANMLGQYIVQGLDLELPEGRSDYDLPVGQMTAGEYFIRILYNDEKIVRKFIISR